MVIFIDEYTSFTWLYPLFAKFEVFTRFTHLYAYVENQFSTSIKCLQSDGGGEYMSTQFKDFLLTHGVIHQVSHPYTPQQNGLVERNNRHLVETMITLLAVACLPQQFWFHAIAHTVFLINRMPSKVLAHQSPYPASSNIWNCCLSLSESHKFQ